MIRATLALVLAATGGAALADDTRIVEKFYDAGKVVRIDGRTKVQATIQFAEDEHIENVAIGTHLRGAQTRHVHQVAGRVLSDSTPAASINARIGTPNCPATQM